MRIEPEISGVSVVMLGNFNPAIFTPAWFALHELLPANVANTAKPQVIHPTLTVFSTEWLHLEVNLNRFLADTQKNPYVRVRNLLVRVFREHLPHTPLNAFGINRRVHFGVKNPAERHRIGRMLAPPEPWGAWKDELGLDNKYGGMTSLTMTQPRPEDRPSGGQINIKIEPSSRIEGNNGIYVEVNDHYAAANGEKDGNEELMDLLESCFDKSIQRSDEIIDHIMSL